MLRRSWLLVLAWYDGLPRSKRDAVDQALHVAAGFAIASLGTAAAAWGWAHWREFQVQAPIERIEDTRRDMRFVLYGAVGGQVVNLALFAALCSAVF